MAIKYISKPVPASIFWILSTGFLLVSFVGLLLTTSGYSLIYMFIYVLPVYFLSWILLTVACLGVTTVRYPSILLYIILGFSLFLILFSIGDAGYYGIGCQTKNLIQSFFDRSTGCTRLWLDPANYHRLVFLYDCLCLIFAGAVLAMKPGKTKVH
jgi:hypothetical protein